MAWYVVSYDLRREVTSQAWAAIYDALTSASDWCRPLHSFWVLETDLAPSAVIAALLNAGVIDDNDGIVVLEITGRGNYRRVIGEDAANWLDAHIVKS